MIIRVDAAFFEAMRAAGYDIDRRRLLEIYGKAKATRKEIKSAHAKLEAAGQLRIPGTERQDTEHKLGR